MLNPKTINDFVKDVCDNLPPAIKKMPENIELKVRAAMLTTFAKMDLVTRDEFDAQVKVLERTRIKLEEMETRLAKYEKNKFPDK